MIEIGGEIVVSGISENNQPWKIGINKPVEDSTNMNTEIQTILRHYQQSNRQPVGTIATSTTKGGKKFAHTIDPEQVILYNILCFQLQY